MKEAIRVANVQAFWGDYSQAAADMLHLAPEVDYLTMDYLAEVSMSILAKQMRKHEGLGYARDFIKVIESAAPYWRDGSKVKIISNAGGLTPKACAERCAEVLREAGCRGKRIGIVSGDGVLDQMQTNAANTDFNNLDSTQSLQESGVELLTANAYVGAKQIVEALDAEADLIITGRVADPSMVVAPCLFEHGWAWGDYDRLAGATVAGHLIECGTQVTGGISTHWMELEEVANIGYPIVEIDASGGCVVTKPAGTGGRVDQRSVKEQLLYELGDPGHYLSPDVEVSFLLLELADLGQDRVGVSGARGSAPPSTLKVSGTYQAGYHTSGSLTIYGPDAALKAQRAGEVVMARLAEKGMSPEESRIECIGAGAIAPLPHSVSEVVLRVSLGDSRREVLQQFATDWVSLVCCGPPGTTGYAGGRPRVHETIAYWPCLISQQNVTPSMEILEV
ncbi:MAG: acyclic terpene utilization AtuA family protein [Planctomycetota bacterium]